MPNYSIDQVKKIPPKILLKLIQRGKDALKKNRVYKDMCKDHGVSPEIIDVVPMKFGDLDVSARTERGVITLSYKLLTDGSFESDVMYILHEMEHYLSQVYGEKPTPGASSGDYLKNPAEQDAFIRQIEYIDDMYGEDKAEDYTDHLLDHHDKSGRERKKLKDKLMENTDEK
jgi:hypothetical protein